MHILPMIAYMQAYVVGDKALMDILRFGPLALLLNAVLSFVLLSNA
jgi:hypothetical protein